MTPVLWGRANAYNVMKVDCLLRELGIGFEHRDLGRTPGDLDTPAFRAMNPLGRVPVLHIDGVYLRESNSICRYLAEKSADAHWWPTHSIRPVQLNAWVGKLRASSRGVRGKAKAIQKSGVYK